MDLSRAANIVVSFGVNRPESSTLVLNTENFHMQTQSLPAEIWGKIASFLSRWDLRSLVFVPHPLSSIARQLLFRDISVVFTTDKPDPDEEDDDGTEEMEKRHAQLSAEILSRLIADPACASQVRTLKVWAPEDSTHILFPLFMGEFTFPPESPLC